VTVSVPIRRGVGVFMNVPLWEHFSVDRIFDGAKLTTCKHHCSLLLSRIHRFQVVSLEIFIHNFGLNSGNMIFMW
jgi:hypothetical protein